MSYNIDDAISTSIRRMKMKYLCFLVFIVAISGCSMTPAPENTVINNNKIIEEAILWKAKIDGRGDSIELKKLINTNNKDFIITGNFYQVKADYYAFGHKVTYLGLIGVHVTPGPNISVIGNPTDISKEIEKLYNLKMETKYNGDAYIHELKKGFMLMVIKHPSNKNETIVIGSYSY